jgi:hypothetical protein
VKVEVLMATETLGFNDRDMRDTQYRRWKAEGSFGLARYSTHQGNDPQIIYVVSRAEPATIPFVADLIKGHGFTSNESLQMDKVMEEGLKLAKQMDELEDDVFGGENDGQDSVHDSEKSQEPREAQDMLSEGGNPAEGNSESKDNPEFRDWSA